MFDFLGATKVMVTFREDVGHSIQHFACFRLLVFCKGGPLEVKTVAQGGIALLWIPWYDDL